MMIRILFLKYFVFSLSFFSLYQSQTIIKKDTNWSKDLVLRESVTIDSGATLTIQSGVTISLEYIDADTNNIGDISIKVLGVLNIKGSINSPVVFKPLRSTNKNTHWQGISFLNSSRPSKINYLELSFKYLLYLFKLSSGHIFFGSYISSKQVTSFDKFNQGSLSFVNICT